MFLLQGEVVKLCDICGSGGFGELIATCSKCGISQEHLYCMGVLFKDTIEDWICETCISCTDIASPVSLGCGRKEDSQNCSDALRHESHEALIISDDLRGAHHSKRHPAVTTGKVKFLTAEEVIRLSSGTAKKESPSISNFRCRTIHSSVTSKISPIRVPPNPPRIIPSRLIKPSVHGRMQASSTTNNKQSPRTSKGENSCPVAVAINSDVEERDLMDILPKLRLYHPHFPALHVAWKGGFKFDVAALLCPDFSDIALYFFPSANIERSKENHASLFHLMETENAAIRSYIYGIELLIFTSKQLHVDSQDIIASERDDHANMDRDEAVDMEIDMVGGTFIEETGNWAQIIRIALDVANRLYYLHSFTETAYVHQDIKSSNVMLNDNLRAKIANFSLARAAASAAMTKHVVGSIGYMAPEYVRGGQVTPKIDVYAFGVVLLEMITGKDAVFTQDDREVLLSTTIVSIMENKNPEVELDFLVDPALKGSCRTDFALCLAKVSVACLIKEPARRPSMEEVVSILLKIQANVQKS
ncbi:hypothetical protein OIU77_009992 [Salix suchowensis]|uniref:Protein kinase domain-containing protein n=1 Tax=Salix suchowensis TaxID=1278906 RepID=A0ABQ9A6W4_9ROSI|nr:hypothetical protein OIU77_009992 [Salix suchowensis]